MPEQRHGFAGIPTRGAESVSRAVFVSFVGGLDRTRWWCQDGVEATNELIGEKRMRVVRVLACGAATVALMFGALAPANAWGSKHVTSSPGGCWGGFDVSSYVDEGGYGIAITKRATGAGCALAAPTYGASLRLKVGGFVGGATSTSYAVASYPLGSGCSGGFHKWGSVSATT